MSDDFTKSHGVTKRDSKLGIYFGFAMISKKGGEDYYDRQGDHPTEDAIVKAAADFVESGAVSKVMHQGDADGTIPFVMPITTEMLDYLKSADSTGLLIGMKPSAATAKRMEAGELPSFSIGGSYGETEEVD